MSPLTGLPVPFPWWRRSVHSQPHNMNAVTTMNKLEKPFGLYMTLSRPQMSPIANTEENSMTLVWSIPVSQHEFAFMVGFRAIRCYPPLSGQRKGSIATGFVMGAETVVFLGRPG